MDDFIKIKALKIIIKKSVDIRWLKAKYSVDEYNRWTYFNSPNDYLTQEEFDLLKGVIRDEE